MLHSLSPSSGCQRKSLHGFKISLSRESFLGRTQLNARGPQTTVFHFNVFPTNEVLRKNAQTFTDVLLSAEFLINSRRERSMTKDLQKYCGFVADAFTYISVTDDQKLEVSRARTTLRCESNFSVWPPSTVSIFSRCQRLRITFVSHLQTCLTVAPSSTAEGSKSTCVGCQRLPVRLTLPKDT